MLIACDQCCPISNILANKLAASLLALTCSREYTGDRASLDARSFFVIDAAVLYGRSFTLLATLADAANWRPSDLRCARAGSLPRAPAARGLFRARQRTD